MMGIEKALKAINPNAQFAVYGDGTIDWLSQDIEQPSEEAIQAKLKEIEEEYEKQNYARTRASQYPSINDVVVALAEKEEGDDSMWKEITALRQKVKTDNPKPT